MQGYPLNHKFKYLILLIITAFSIDVSYARFQDAYPDGQEVYKSDPEPKAQPTSSEIFTNLTNIKLLGAESNQITTEPNESINLFTGTVHRTYKEISIPVAPGLNMEFIRSYGSSAYNDREYLSNEKYNNIDLTHPNWRFDSGYIITETGCKDAGYDNCNPVYVSADGNSQKLIPDDNIGNTYKTKHYWRGTKDNNSRYILTDTRGFKYYFEHNVILRPWYETRAVKSFLTRIETPDGEWVKYSYNLSYLVEVTSSDSSKKIRIDYTTGQDKLEGMHYYVQLPHKVYFNNKHIVTYGYTSLRKDKQSHNIFPVTSAQYTNGRTLSYGYGWVGDYLTVTSISHSNMDKSIYQYVVATGLKFGPVKLIKKTVHSQGQYNTMVNDWDFTYRHGVGEDAIKTLTTEVDGPVRKFSTTFSDYHDSYAWRAGLPLKHVIYEDKSNNILQQVNYSWDKSLFSRQPKYGGVIFFNQQGKDDATYLAQLVNKDVQRDGLRYSANYLDYDKYNNANKIIEIGDNGKIRATELNYFYNTENNIIGYLQGQRINNQEILKRKFDTKGHMLSESNNRMVTKYRYDAKGNVYNKIDAKGNTTTYSNYRGIHPQKVIQADGSTITNQVDSAGNIKRHTDSLGHTIEYNYNSFNQKTYEKPAIGHESRVSHNNYSQEDLQNNKLIKTDYNLSGQPVLITMKDLKSNQSKVKRNRYDAQGRKIFESFVYEEEDYTGNLYGHYYSYDSLNRLVKACYPMTHLHCDTYEYNQAGQNSVKITKANGEFVIKYLQSYSSEEDSELVKIKDAYRTTDITRDDFGRVTAIKQGNLSRTYRYDNQNNMIATSAPDTGLVEYKHDALGHVIQKTINKSKIVKYDYDNKNYNLLNVTYSDDTPSATFSYDAVGNMLSANKGYLGWKYKYDSNNNLLSENLSLNKLDDTQLNFNLKYTYDGYNNLQSLSYPDKTVINYSPNVFGEPSKINNYIDNIHYHPSGFWQNMHFANGLKLSSTLDKLKRPIKTSIDNMSYDYTYDSSNNLLQIKTDNNYIKELNFAYDLNGRITSAIGPWGRLNYTYDINDNITNITNQDRNIKSDDKHFAYDKNNHLVGMSIGRTKKPINTALWEYDQAGFLISDDDHNYSYDLDDNLWKISGNEKEYYDYDAFNQRTVKYSKNNEVITVFNKAGQELYEYNLINNIAKKFVYLSGKKVIQLDAELESDTKEQKQKEEISYFFNDTLGSPLMIFDKSGKLKWREVYLPYGQRFSLNKSNGEEQANKHWFAGKEQDSSGLSYFGSRYYTSKLGRFLTPDPVDVSMDNPASFNRYAYANNNPYKYVDPNGETATEWFNDLMSGLGDGSLFGMAGTSEHQYRSAYIVGFGLGVGSWASGGGEAVASIKVGANVISNISKRSVLKKSLNSAQESYKGSSRIGHALSKHAGRNPQVWGKMQGSMDTWNNQGVKHLREIYRGPGEFKQITNANNGLTFLEKRLDDGRGVRFNQDYTFKGFID